MKISASRAPLTICRLHITFFLAALALIVGCGRQHDDTSSVKNIFGTDDRTIVPDQFPYTAVGRLDSGCTGTLISDTLVLTGAHCVVDSTTGSVKSNLGWFRPNLRNNDQNGAAAWIVRAWVGSENPDGNRLRDFAVLELDTRMGSRFGTLPVRDFDMARQIPFRTDLVGYSLDRDNGSTATMHRGCLIREIVQDRLFHECDGFAGVSGGPMLNTYNNHVYISAMTVSEFRQGAAGSVTRDAYSQDYANVAIRAQNFIPLIDQLLSTVARGLPPPVIPDITLKVNPTTRPDGGTPGRLYYVDDVASEVFFMRNEVLLQPKFLTLRDRVLNLSDWANQISDPRLMRLSSELESDARNFYTIVGDTVDGAFRGQHKLPVYRSWNQFMQQLTVVRDYPRVAGRPGIQTQLNQLVSPIDSALRDIEASIFE